MMKYLLLSWLLLGSLLAWAQPQAYNWRFGNHASLTFPNGGAPVVNAPTTALANEGCASISDQNGVLQCYANGAQVWDRTNALMPNGSLTGSNTSATQAALLLPAPGQPTRYYLLTVDAQENGYQGGLRRSVVDMTLRGGLGDVETPKSVPVSNPDGALLAEKLTAVRHANGRDYWVVVHGNANARFYCYLLTPGGLSNTPVVSQAGNAYNGSDAIGYLRASPNGQLLAAGELSRAVEIFDFDKSSGSVVLRKTLPQALPTYHYGLEFSPNSTKLYVSNGIGLYQLDLSNNYALTSLGGNGIQALQRGPDGRIYAAQYQSPWLSVVQNPNAAGSACNFSVNAISLAPAANMIGLPNFPNDFAPPLAISAPQAVCAGTRLTVTAAQAPANATFSWDFGDGTGSTTGSPATHTYAQGGTYVITLTAIPAGGSASTAQQTVTVTPGPDASLGSRRQLLCTGQSLLLAPPAQPAGTTYRWQDGSTAASYLVRTSGHYVLTLTSPGGCPARDSVDVDLSPPPSLHLAPPAVLCDYDRPVVLRANAQPDGTTYRWQDGTTTATYVARQPGRYRLEVRSAAGCTARDSVDVRGPAAAGECVPVLIPNLIIPDNGTANATFYLQGLLAADWQLVVYSRWGREVHRQASYDNSWAATQLPGGLYFYRLTHSVTNQHYQGWVEVLR